MREKVNDVNYMSTLIRIKRRDCHGHFPVLAPALFLERFGLHYELGIQTQEIVLDAFLRLYTQKARYMNLRLIPQACSILPG